MDEEACNARAKHVSFNHKAKLGEQEMLARGEVVVKPSAKEDTKVVFSPQAAVLAMCYFCSFGGELAINNSILCAYYIKNFPKFGQTGTGRWAAMFGLPNGLCRLLGGIVSDLLYRRTVKI